MVQVPLLLMAVRREREAMRIVEETPNPRHGVEQWLSGLGLDTISVGMLVQLLTASAVCIRTVGELVDKGHSDVENFSSQLPLGVRRPFIKAVQDVRSGRHTVLGEARGAFDAKWDVAVPVHEFLTDLGIFDAASVNTAAKAFLDGERVRTKGSLLALTTTQLQSLAAQLPTELQDPLLDAVQHAIKSGRGWCVAPVPAPTAFTLEAADQGRASLTWERKGMMYTTCKHCNEMKERHFMSLLLAEGGALRASRHCFNPQGFRCVDCGKTEAEHHGSTRACMDEAGVFATAQVWAADRLQSRVQQVRPSRVPTQGGDIC